MKLNLKDEPKEWRKSALLTIFGLALIVSLLRWRRHFPQNAWLAVLTVLGATALAAIFRPRWFRGCHRLSMRLGFTVSQFLGRVLLAVFFIFILTPMGWILRLAGKDPLQLRRPQNAATYWHPSKESSPLDRLL
ncbi:MAG TPA: SxtJ family membrane protein [Verrucomicrobiae bacterium]|nr:SxtJ family membrane protein [Verrucomicrobiae bacterium]